MQPEQIFRTIHHSTSGVAHNSLHKSMLEDVSMPAICACPPMRFAVLPPDLKYQ
jgi:hypothetical protein